MNMKRGFEVASAATLSALALAWPSPDVQAANHFKPNQNPANRLAKKIVKRIGGRVLNLARRDGIYELATANTVASDSAEMSLALDNGSSTVAGSNGRYTVDIFADRIGRNGLDRSDINNVRVAEGSAPDGRPLFSLRMFTPHPHSRAPNEGGARHWYVAEGTALLASGDRAEFSGSVDPGVLNYPPDLVLDAAEVRAAGHTMDTILDDAFSGQPTSLEYPPFGPLQR